MIDKGQWREFGQDTGVTPLLFTRSAMGFLMTTESQDLGLTLIRKTDRKTLWRESVNPEYFTAVLWICKLSNCNLIMNILKCNIIQLRVFSFL